MSERKALLHRSLDKTFDEVEGLNLLSPHEVEPHTSAIASNSVHQIPTHERSDSYEATLSQISYLMQKLQQDSAAREPTINQTTVLNAASRLNADAQHKWGNSTSVSNSHSWVSSVPRVASKPRPSSAKPKSQSKFNGAVEERLLAFGKQTSQKKLELREQQVAKLNEELLDVKMSKVPITKLARSSSEHVAGVPIADRLYQYGLRSKDRRARLAMARIADEEAKMKSPMINSASQKCNRTVEDLLAWEQNKNQRHNQMRLSKESSFSSIQQPSICKGTLKIVEKMKERFAIPLEQRLMNNHKEAKIEELKREISRQESDAIESSKVPMSEVSRQLIAQKTDRDNIAIGIRLSQNRRHSCFYVAAEKVDFTHAAPKESEKNVGRPASAPRERSSIPIEDRLLAMGELYEEKKKQEIAQNNLRAVVVVPKVFAERENSADCVWNRLFQEKILTNKGQRISCRSESPRNFFDKLDDIENCTFRPKVTAVSQELDRRYSGGKTGVSRLEWMYEWAIQKDQKQELLRSLQQSDIVYSATASSSSNKKFNEVEFFERMKQFEDSRAKSSTALKIHQEQEQLKECTFTPLTHHFDEEKRNLRQQQRPNISLQPKRSTSPSYAALHGGRSRSAASSRNSTPKKQASSSDDFRAIERVSQLLDTSVASATSDKKATLEKVSMDLLFAKTHK